MPHMTANAGVASKLYVLPNCRHAHVSIHVLHLCAGHIGMHSFELLCLCSVMPGSQGCLRETVYTPLWVGSKVLGPKALITARGAVFPEASELKKHERSESGVCRRPPLRTLYVYYGLCRPCTGSRWGCMRVRILWLGVPLWSGCLSMNNVANIPGARGARRRAVSAHPLVYLQSASLFECVSLLVCACV